jgi:excisionase family DNA binding protein
MLLTAEDVRAAAIDRSGAAKYLGCGTTKIAEMVGADELRSFRIGRRRLFRITDLDAFIESQVEA